jgi:hypothetical protein
MAIATLGVNTSQTERDRKSPRRPGHLRRRGIPADTIKALNDEVRKVQWDRFRAKHNLNSNAGHPSAG